MKVVSRVASISDKRLRRLKSTLKIENMYEHFRQVSVTNRVGNPQMDLRSQEINSKYNCYSENPSSSNIFVLVFCFFFCTDSPWNYTQLRLPAIKSPITYFPACNVDKNFNNIYKQQISCAIRSNSSQMSTFQKLRQESQLANDLTFYLVKQSSCISCKLCFIK